MHRLVTMEIRVFLYVAVLLLPAAHGREVNLEATRCLNGLPIVKCFADPCTVTKCPNFPDATCVSNYCGGCNAIFYDSVGNDVTNSCRCPVKGQVIKPCASSCTATCQDPFPRCVEVCVLDKCECPNGQVINSAINSCVPRNKCPRLLCPPGVSTVACKINPCLKAQCPGNPEAVCRPDYCGGCYAKFFDSNGEEVTSSCSGSVDSSMVNDEEYYLP